MVPTAADGTLAEPSLCGGGTSRSADRLEPGRRVHFISDGRAGGISTSAGDGGAETFAPMEADLVGPMWDSDCLVRFLDAGRIACT